jgi:uncharacterized protein YajQ (UPF0234 family)
MGGKSAEEPAWYMAERCDGGQCVQVGIQGESILVRSSIDPDGHRVTLSRDEWQAFIAGVKGGDFDNL